MVNLILILLSIVMLQACSVYQYVPAPNYIPLHTRKKEIRGNITPSSIQASYSITNSTFVAVSAFGRRPEDTWGTGKEHGGGRLGYEKSNDKYIAFGYFKPFNAVHLELLGGAGMGSLKYR